MQAGRGAVLAALVLSAVSAIGAEEKAPGEAVSFSALPGFATDDLTQTFRAFRASCAEARATRPAQPPPRALKAVCKAAAQRRSTTSPAGLRSFFETHFTPRRVPGEAFFTGYYEPVVVGSLTSTSKYKVPLYGPPADLVSVAAGKTPGLDPALTAARRLPDGRLIAVPERGAIETGALGSAIKPLVYVESSVEAFFIQVQGSARIRLPDGRLRRLVFAARNGHPYTSIGKLLVARLAIPPSQMGMAQLRAWIRDNGQGEGEAGSRLMRENRSYIFFRLDDTLAPSAGPIGGEGLSLTAGRSLAIDRSQWPYGLPFYVDTRLPEATPFRRLMVGQDTGSAIIGAARADIFFGSGDEAARQAGAIRQNGTLYVLWPKASSR